MLNKCINIRCCKENVNNIFNCICSSFCMHLKENYSKLYIQYAGWNGMLISLCVYICTTI